MEEKKELISKIGTQIDGAEAYLRQLRDIENNKVGRFQLAAAELNLGRAREMFELYLHDIES